ncbi:hypothetical protein ZWY2020_027608 [Hordeum vulgare]|nr:hypothetical protein ZWY2020_027608 [Hordeum vulgare]
MSTASQCIFFKEKREEKKKHTNNMTKRTPQIPSFRELLSATAAARNRQTARGTALDTVPESRGKPTPAVLKEERRAREENKSKARRNAEIQAPPPSCSLRNAEPKHLHPSCFSSSPGIQTYTSACSEMMIRHTCVLCFPLAFTAITTQAS